MAYNWNAVIFSHKILRNDYSYFIQSYHIQTYYTVIKLDGISFFINSKEIK